MMEKLPLVLRHSKCYIAGITGAELKTSGKNRKQKSKGKLRGKRI